MIEINLKNRKALVTGGSRGIGAGICRAFAECGADVAFTFKSNQTAADSVVQELQQKGVKAAAFQAPAEDEDAMRSAVDGAAQALGGLDILVNNVGGSKYIPFTDLSIDDLRAGLETNLFSVLIAVKLAYPHLIKADQGSVLMIGSSAAYDGGGGAAYYAPAKAGLFGLTKKLMRIFSEHNIRVNTIHPCLVETDLMHSNPNWVELIARKKAQVPLGRTSSPEDIANLAAFLCSDLAGFITGQSILVDGGRTIWRRGFSRV